MPPRKSTSRKSDVTAARAVPVEEAQPKESSSSTPANATPAAEPSPAAGTPSEKKDKEKEKEKDKDKEKEKEKDKDKEKEKDKSKGHDDAVAIEDLTLPKSIITRLSKGVLPPNTQIQGNAILALSNSATVFISYLASHANENTLAAGKKTISPADVFKALEDTEFSFLKDSLEAEFAKFNAIQTEKRTSYRQKVRAKKSDGPDTDMADNSLAEADGDTTMASEASGPRTKRARVDPTAAPEAEEDDAETEDEEPVPEDDDDEDNEEEEEDEEDEAEASGDETQDALEEKQGREDADEALDGDESD